MRRAAGVQRVLLLVAALLLAGGLRERHAAPGRSAQIPLAADPALDLRVDVNRASAADLEALPGIGPARAAAIVAHRDRRRPFASLDDLVGVAAMPAATVAALEPCLSFR